MTRRSRRTAPGRPADAEAPPKPKPARSWRVSRRIEENLPPEPRGDADVDVDLVGTPVEQSDDMLTDVQRHLGLDDSEVGMLFGVEAEAIERWRRHGVPESCGERLAHLYETVEMLRSHEVDRSPAERGASRSRRR